MSSKAKNHMDGHQLAYPISTRQGDEVAASSAVFACSQAAADCRHAQDLVMSDFNHP